MTIQDLKPLERWRLILGEPAQDKLGSCPSSLDGALSWLYDRENQEEGRGVRGRSGGSEGSRLTVPDWLEEVHQLFPKQAIERLEKDAVERFGIDEVVTNPEVLEKLTPNENLLKAVLRTKHLMNPAVLALARKMVQQVIERLLEKLRTEVRSALVGKRHRQRPSNFKVARNFDLKKTIRRNLKNYQPQQGKLLVSEAHFFSRTKRHSDRWQVIVLVDQSGSMLGSLIHASVTAACLYGLPGIKTHLILFDTNVVDLTDRVTDPVETLMKVQLGGGTDIARAVEYGATLVEVPKRSIFVVVSDFYEGGNPYALVRRTEKLVQSGVTVLGLGALDEQADPAYDREMAQALQNVGAHMGAMTPGELANFIAERVQG